MKNIFVADDDFGLILESALRYSLGRLTYMPDLTRKYIRRYEHCLSVNRLFCMKRDVDEFLGEPTEVIHTDDFELKEWREFADHLGEICEQHEGTDRDYEGGM